MESICPIHEHKLTFKLGLKKFAEKVPPGGTATQDQHKLTVATFRSWRGWAAVACTGPGDTISAKKLILRAGSACPNSLDGQSPPLVNDEVSAGGARR